MQFHEPKSKQGKCSVCGKPTIIRSTRTKDPTYCSRVCAAQERYSKRYRGTNSGPLDRPSQISKTKLP